MLSKEILQSHPISVLKKEISKTNIRGYSKMKKSEVVDLMMKNKDRFGHIRMKEKKTAQTKIQPKKKEVPKASLKELKAKLKLKGLPSMALKFIKTVEQAQERLNELEAKEPEDKKVQISKSVLERIPVKNQAKIKKLILKVLPRAQFTLQDQVEYFDDLKEMADNYNMSSIPRQRYNSMDANEKELFELLYPALFDQKAKKKRADAKRADRKKTDK